MVTKIYPRTGDKQTVYLNAVVKDPRIEVGDYTIYNDFVADPLLFEREKQCVVSLPPSIRRGWLLGNSVPLLVVRNFCSTVPITLKSLSTYTFLLYFTKSGIEEIGHNGCMG